MAQPFDLPALDLAALLCSRVCHDVISPVGAIGNGLEVLDEDDSEEMREVAIELIRSSARSAANRLKFARMAFGFGGSLGAEIDLGEAEEVARGYIETERTKLVWTPPRRFMGKDRVKLLLTLLAVAGQAIPTGGTITAAAEGEGVSVVATGARLRVPAGLEGLLAGAPAEAVDAHAVVAFYAGLVARSIGLAASVTMEGDRVTIAAVPTAGA